MSTDHQSALRKLPSVDSLVRHPVVAPLTATGGRELVVYAVRRVLDQARQSVLRGEDAADPRELAHRAASEIAAVAVPTLKPVINATGVILHTNLGRAPLGSVLVDEIAPLLRGYSNIELDLSNGRRGRRGDHFIPLLRYLTGAQDALAVNNNAAALILCLSTLARDREVIISRGELIEIGGAFRIPEIMAAGGARMVEVGATNRTRLSDYEEAITEETAVIFKAHTSNYRIVGFTEDVCAGDLSRLARKRGVVMIYDIGSGLLRRPPGSVYGSEPDVHGALGAGADLVTFSCDKLLGGPQAGVVAGRADLISMLSRAPLMRALRIGKLTVAALSCACRHYLRDESLIRNNPAFEMFSAPAQRVLARAERLTLLLREQGVACAVVENTAQTGGGAMPDIGIPSYAVEITPPRSGARVRERFAEGLHAGLMRIDHPVLGILREGRVLFDLLCVSDAELPPLAAGIAVVASSLG